MTSARSVLAAALLLALCGALHGLPPSTPRPKASPTPVPTPVPPPRVEVSRKGLGSKDRDARFPSPEISFSRILRVEEVDLDRDGVSEALVDGIGTVERIPEDIPVLGFLSRYRLPFESPLLAIMRKTGSEWHPIWIAHVPLRCGQTDDLSVCDEIPQFRTIRFRFDDRPQVIFQMLHAGETGLHETYAYRLVKGRLETTFSASLPRPSVNVSVDTNGIERRLAADTFLNRELPVRYRSFTLKTVFVFGENRFRVATDVPEDAWSADKAETELVYWGLVHQSNFAPDVERLRERQKMAEAWSFDPVEVVRHRYADAVKVRLGAKAAGVCVVFFERPNGCNAHALLYQPIREWEGERTFWDVAALRGQKDPFECVEEPPLR